MSYHITYHIIYYISSKEVYKSNFQQYGEMKKQSAGRRVRREKIIRKTMQVREKVGKSRNTVFFRGFVAPEGWKVGSLKRRVRRHLGRWEMKSCTPLWREADFEVKRYKTLQDRTTFWSWDVGKVYSVVEQSTFGSNMHVLKIEGFGALFEVEMLEKCTALWREAHLEVKCVKNWGSRSTFGSWDVEKVHGVVARSTFRSQNVQNTRGSDHFWRFRCRFASLHYTTLHYTTLHSTTLHYTTLLQLHNHTPLHSTALNYTTLH